MSTIELSAFPEELLEGILKYCVVAPLSAQVRPSWHRPSGLGASSSSSLPSSSSSPTSTSNSTSSTTPPPATTPATAPTPPPIRGRLAFLLVSKQFRRICTPLFYHTLHLSSPNQLHRLLSSSLRPNPHYALSIRRVVFGGVWAEGGELLRMCAGSVRLLDVMLDTTQLGLGLGLNTNTLSGHGQVRDLDAEEFCEGLREVRGLTHLVVRKPGHVYLTQAKPRYVLAEVARAVEGWDELEFADLAFRLSDDSGTLVLNLSNPSFPALHVPQTQAQAYPHPQMQTQTQTQPLPPPHQPHSHAPSHSPSPSQTPAHSHLPSTPSTTTRPSAPSPTLAPITALTHALSTRPKLHTFSTLLPSVWNETVLRVSRNPALERIILGDGQGQGYGHGQGQGHGHGTWYPTGNYPAYVSFYSYGASGGASGGGCATGPGMGAGAGSFRANGATWSAADFYAGPVSASMSPGATFESANGNGNGQGQGQGQGQGGILGTGLFLSQARKHARLSELIRNGTSIIRTRAQTLGTPPLPSSLPILPASVPQRHPVSATPQASHASTSDAGAYVTQASPPEERNISSKKFTAASVSVDFPQSSSSGMGSGSSSGLRD